MDAIVGVSFLLLFVFFAMIQLEKNSLLSRAPKHMLFKNEARVKIVFLAQQYGILQYGLSFNLVFAFNKHDLPARDIRPDKSCANHISTRNMDPTAMLITHKRRHQKQQQ